MSKSIDNFVMQFNGQIIYASHINKTYNLDPES